MKTPWTFTCLCWNCYRILELPARPFLQGDPICKCGSQKITADAYARLEIEDLKNWNQEKPFTTKDMRIINKWQPEDGATFQEQIQLNLF